ncbi:hypothetical protein BDA96_10G120300 [Sorghum bicolor]|uniref:Uncharacterized protein n=1 Tax=Sorghum bicolor TaxID=4558 RepID=A0A921Q0Z9_SORBI|nr:hypothetical protein BDA96_10G120300 [Sorghum bicolor]
MKSGIAARFPVFSSRIKTTTRRVRRVSPCDADASRAAPLLPREAVPVARPPPFSQVLRAPPPAPSRSRREAPRITSSRLRPSILSTPPRHPSDNVAAPRLLRTGFPSPVPSRRLPTSQVEVASVDPDPLPWMRSSKFPPVLRLTDLVAGSVLSVEAM